MEKLGNHGEPPEPKNTEDFTHNLEGLASIFRFEQLYRQKAISTENTVTRQEMLSYIALWQISQGDTTARKIYEEQFSADFESLHQEIEKLVAYAVDQNRSRFIPADREAIYRQRIDAICQRHFANGNALFPSALLKNLKGNGSIRVSQVMYGYAAGGWQGEEYDRALSWAESQLPTISKDTFIARGQQALHNAQADPDFISKKQAATVFPSYLLTFPEEYTRIYPGGKESLLGKTPIQLHKRAEKAIHKEIIRIGDVLDVARIAVFLDKQGVDIQEYKTMLPELFEKMLQHKALDTLSLPVLGVVAQAFFDLGDFANVAKILDITQKDHIVQGIILSHIMAKFPSALISIVEQSYMAIAEIEDILLDSDSAAALFLLGFTGIVTVHADKIWIHGKESEAGDFQYQAVLLGQMQKEKETTGEVSDETRLCQRKILDNARELVRHPESEGIFFHILTAQLDLGSSYGDQLAREVLLSEDVDSEVLMKMIRILFAYGKLDARLEEQFASYFVLNEVDENGEGLPDTDEIIEFLRLVTQRFPDKIPDIYMLRAYRDDWFETHGDTGFANEYDAIKEEYIS